MTPAAAAHIFRLVNRLFKHPSLEEKTGKQYTDKDLKVHTADGQVAGFGTKIKVSGKVYFPLVG